MCVSKYTSICNELCFFWDSNNYYQMHYIYAVKCKEYQKYVYNRPSKNKYVYISSPQKKKKKVCVH